MSANNYLVQAYTANDDVIAELWFDTLDEAQEAQERAHRRLTAGEFSDDAAGVHILTVDGEIYSTLEV